MIDLINDPSILEEVLDEAFELRQDLEQCLLVLESNPEDLDSVHRAFRCVHSIKGNCGMLGLDAISEFTHELESVLDRLRKEEIEFTRTTCDLLLAGADVLEGLLAHERATVGSADSIASTPGCAIQNFCADACLSPGPAANSVILALSLRNAKI